MNTTKAEKLLYSFIPRQFLPQHLTNGRIPQWEVRAELNE